MGINNRLEVSDFVELNFEKESPKQPAWSVYNAIWGRLGYDMSNSNSNVIPVSRSQFPKLEEQEFGLNQESVLTRFKNIVIDNPRTKPEVLLSELSTFFGKDFMLPVQTYAILLDFLEYPSVAEAFEKFLSQAEKLRQENLSAVEQSKLVNFMEKGPEVFMLGNSIYTEMMVVRDEYIENQVTKSKLSPDESKKLAEKLNEELPNVIRRIKDECIQKMNILNTQDVIDVIRLAPFDMELDKPEDQRDYVKECSSDPATRYYTSHTALQHAYDKMTLEEKVLFDAGYELKGALNAEQFVWKKSAWERPKQNDPLVYKLHVGYGQPGGDVREGTLVFDLSKLNRGHFSKEEGILVFNYLAAAVNASTSKSFENEFNKHQSALEKVAGVDGALLIKEAAAKFRKEVDPVLFSIEAHLGHPEESSNLCRSRGEEFMAIVEFNKLVKARGLGWSNQEIDAMKTAFSVPQFREAFKELLGIYVNKFKNNEVPPFGKNHGGIEEKIKKMEQTALTFAQMLFVQQLGNSLITGENN